MPSDPLSAIFNALGAPSPAARAQATADHASVQDTQAAAGAPPLPDPPGTAHEALREALDSIQPPLSHIEHSLEHITALLQALAPRRPITVTLYVDNINGQVINADGRDFVGVRSSLASPAILFQRMTGLTSSITVTSAFQYFAASDGVRVLAAAQANNGNYEFIFTDAIGGAVPQ